MSICCKERVLLLHTKPHAVLLDLLHHLVATGSVVALFNSEDKCLSWDNRVGSVKHDQKVINYTCRQAVVFKDFTEDQFVGVEGERVSEHADRDEEQVTVGALGLVRARAIKVPLRNI